MRFILSTFRVQFCRLYTNNRNVTKACKRDSGGMGLLLLEGLQARILKDETKGVV